MSYRLLKPYSSKARLEFIVKYNHGNGLTIQETSSALYALLPSEEIKNGEVVINENYNLEQEIEEKKKIAKLSLTAADVERAIYKIKGLDFDDILTQLSTNTDIDIKALKIELKANNFYRGNLYVEQIGKYLGFSSTQLDKFFLTGDSSELEHKSVLEDEYKKQEVNNNDIVE